MPILNTSQREQCKSDMLKSMQDSLINRFSAARQICYLHLVFPLIPSTKGYTKKRHPLACVPQMSSGNAGSGIARRARKAKRAKRAKKATGGVRRSSQKSGPGADGFWEARPAHGLNWPALRRLFVQILVFAISGMPIRHGVSASPERFQHQVSRVSRVSRPKNLLVA